MEVKESGTYDNFIKETEDFTKKEVSQKSTTLSDIFDDFFIDTSHPNSCDKHWIGMPEFEQNPNAPFKSIIVHCPTEDDYNRLSEVLEQPLTLKSKFAWFPYKEKDVNSLKRWIEE